jgi:peptide-methionine (S)-S-oxide reductase
MMSKPFMLAAAIGISLAIATGLRSQSKVAEQTVLAPMPIVDVRPAGSRAVAVFAGGCFWGVEAVFSHVKGVQSVVSGYAGGGAADANYEAVSSERTRHAEAVRIVYDPRIVSYATLLRVFFSVAHDPTQLNRQGPDRGTSYRSAIFPQSAEQRNVATGYIAQVEKSGVWGRPVVTRLELGGFYPAEPDHQDFAVRNPSHPYIRQWDKPKIAALKTTFPALWIVKPAA